jgi:HK97 family phage prohead protease
MKKTYRAAKVRANSYDEDTGTIQIVWTTGASVRRCDWDGTEYDEILSLEPGAVDLTRLNAGAPLLDTHQDGCVANIVGAVVAGTAKIEDGRGVATVLLSKAADVADTVQKIREGTAKNISCGYWTNKIEKTEGESGVARWYVSLWTPLEISVVPIPADAGAQIRSASRRVKAKQPLTPEQRDFQAGAASATRLLGAMPVPVSKEQARGAVEARSLKAGKGKLSVEQKPTTLDAAEIARGARAARWLLRQAR